MKLFFIAEKQINLLSIEDIKSNKIWSGSRIQMNTAMNLSFKIECDGVIAVVSDPFELPNKGQFIQSGTTTSIVIKPTLSYCASDIYKLIPEQRQFVHDNKSINAVSEERLLL